MDDARNVICCTGQTLFHRAEEVALAEYLICQSIFCGFWLYNWSPRILSVDVCQPDDFSLHKHTEIYGWLVESWRHGVLQVGWVGFNLMDLTPIGFLLCSNSFSVILHVINNVFVNLTFGRKVLLLTMLVNLKLGDQSKNTHNGLNKNTKLFTV